jgi:hypothetical protein
MASTIKLKNGSGAPTTGDLVQGEPALDLTNKRLYTENASGVVIEVGTNPSTIDINAGTIDGTVIGGTTPAAVTTSSLVATTADINAGTIDGTVIGGSTAAAGTFTTGQFNTSLNVTGTVTADGLAVAVSDAALAASIGTDAQRVYITPSGTVINYNASGDSAGSHLFQTGNVNRLNIASNGDISFYEDTGTTAKFFWDASAETISIGTGASSTATISAYSRTVSASLPSALRIIENTGASSYWDIGSTGGASNNLNFYANANTTPKVTFTGAGNVGINETVPFGKLHISDTQTGRTAAGTVGNLLVLEDDENGMSILSADAGAGYILFGDTASASSGGISYDHSENKFNFRTNEAWNRMILDSSGNLLLGTTSAVTGSVAGGFQVQNNSSTGSTINIGHPSGAASGFSYALFSYDNSIIGSIGQSGTTAVLYNTTSDQRLKENITDANDAGDKIDAIQVRQYDWKADGSHQDYGMVAQELMTVAPEAVSGDPESDEMMGVDYSKLVPMLIKEVQSLRARVAQLEGAN